MRRRHVLWVDCSAGLAAGVVVLALSGWLSGLYGLPREIVLVIGAANLAYGAFSLALAVRARRPRALIVLLAAANAAWAVLCWIAAGLLAGAASTVGLALLVFEGLFVGALAVVEWTEREQLLVRVAPK